MDDEADEGIGPTGKRKNCNTWAAYEEPRSSQTAVLCHGGTWQGRYKMPCPSRLDCRAATTQPEKVHLPVMNPSHGFVSKQNPGSQIMVSTEGLWRNRENTLSRLPTLRGSTTPQQQTTTMQRTTNGVTTQVPINGPVPAIPPQTYPPLMRTPYVVPGPTPYPLTPIFLPNDRSSMWKRLGLNVLQGMIGAMAQQLLEYVRSVDMFGNDE